MQTETKEQYLEAINRAIEFIEINATKNISLEEIAEYAFLSKYHFHRVFKSIIGDTVKKYQSRIRLEKSALLLKNSQENISQIAYQCGYNAPEIFNRAFQNYFSMTPTSFRENTKIELKQKQELYEEISFESLNLSSPKIVEISDLHLAYIRHFGNYDKVAKSFQRLMFWAIRNLILKLKPTTLGIIHDSPDLTEEAKLRFDACVLLTKEIKPKGEIGYKKIQGGKFAVFRYQGSYETFYAVYDYIYNICLFDYQWELRDEAALEWYIKSPPFYTPENFVTDFYLPIM